MAEKKIDEFGRVLSVTHTSRYILEHKVIPNLLYSEGFGFMAAIVSKNNVLNKIFKDIMNEEGVENPYGDKPITVDPFKIDNILVARINFPEPEEMPLCYRSYVFFNAETENAAYYSIEKGQNDGEIFLCGWNKEGVHLNYGGCPDDEHEEIVQIVKSFFNPDDDESLKVRVAYSPAKDRE